MIKTHANLIAFVQGNSPDNEQLVVDLHYARLLQISYLRMKVSDFWSVTFAALQYTKKIPWILWIGSLRQLTGRKDVHSHVIRCKLL